MGEQSEPPNGAVEKPSKAPSKSGREKRRENLVPGVKPGQERGPDGKLLPKVKGETFSQAGQSGSIGEGPPVDLGIVRLKGWIEGLLAEIRGKP